MLVFCVSNRKLRRSERPKPRLRPRWALIRVRMAGICNTDVEILHGYHGFRGVPGHEFVGEVAEVAGVSSAEKQRWLGKRVCGEINIACKSLGLHPVCRFCQRGLTKHCARRKVLGIIGQDGAFAEYLALPLENLHVVPPSVNDAEAVFVEPLAAACEILDRMNLKGLQEAAVLGDGKLGQLISRVLRTRISRVVMYGKNPGKLKLAEAARIETKRVRGDRSDLGIVKDAYQFVVEATGAPTGLMLAQHMTEARGTLVLKSTFHGAASVATWPTVVKEITIVGSRCGPFEKALALLKARKVDPKPLVTREFPLGDAGAAIRFAQKRGVMKVLLSGRGSKEKAVER